MAERAARRVRCKGPCGELYPADRLTIVGGEKLCDECLADAKEPDPQPSTPGETQEEKDARLAAIRARVGTTKPAIMDALEDAAEAPTLADLEGAGVTMGDGKPLSESAKIAAKFTDDAKATGDIQPEPEPVKTTDGQGVIGLPISVRDRVPPEADNRDWWADLRSNIRPPGWPLRKVWLSPSSVARLLKCPELFRLRDVIGREERPNHNMIRGGALHAAAEENWRYKIAHGDDMPPIDWEAAYLDHFSDKVKRAGGYGQIHWKGKPSALRDEAIPAIRCYASNIAPSVHPVATERPFSVWVPGVPVPVCGVIDVVTEEGVLDTKFGKQRSKVIKPDWRIAAHIYARAENAPVVYHVGNWGGAFHTPLDEPGLRLPLTPAVHQIAGNIVRSAVGTIQALYAEFGPDQTWPGALTHQYACSDCAFRESGECQWWHPRVETI